MKYYFCLSAWASAFWSNATRSFCRANNCKSNRIRCIWCTSHIMYLLFHKCCPSI